MTQEKITEAHYTTATLDLYRGNPLIEALPDYANVSNKDIAEKLLKLPQKSARMTRRERGRWLASLEANFFVPLQRHIELFCTIDILLRQGYQLRRPHLSPECACFRQNEEYFRRAAEERPSLWHESLSSCVIGCPGTGKTTGADRILALYSQAISHSQAWLGEPLLQIVYLRVACPREGGARALCARIIEEICRIAGRSDAEAFVRPRSSLDSLMLAVVRLMEAHHVGLLVLDDMENMVRLRKNREDFLNFMARLSNSVGLPVLFIGTPKFRRFLMSSMSTARRFASFGSFRWDRLTPTVTQREQTEEGEMTEEKANPDWERFVDGIWQANVLREDGAFMPGAVERKLYELTQGVVDLMVKLMILGQLRALVLSMRSPERIEKLTPELLEEVFEAHFGHLRPLTEALKKNDEKRIEAFEDLSFAEEHFKRSVAALLEELEEGPDDVPGKPRPVTAERILSALEVNEIKPDPELARCIEAVLIREPGLKMHQVLKRAFEQLAGEKGLFGSSR